MTSHTHKSSNKKAQFFILTTVAIVAVFYSLSSSINPNAFIDTSEAAYGSETLFFDNVKNKAIKTVKISNSEQLESNLETYRDFVEEIAREKGYNLAFYFTNTTTDVKISMVLSSQKYLLTSNFTVPLS
jgi:hypothetical protein